MLIIQRVEELKERKNNWSFKEMKSRGFWNGEELKCTRNKLLKNWIIENHIVEEFEMMNNWSVKNFLMLKNWSVKEFKRWRIEMLKNQWVEELKYRTLQALLKLQRNKAMKILKWWRIEVSKK